MDVYSLYMYLNMLMCMRAHNKSLPVAERDQNVALYHYFVCACVKYALQQNVYVCCACVYECVCVLCMCVVHA
jgi:hypothetical protein